MKYKLTTKIFSLFFAILFVLSSGAVFVTAAETAVPEIQDIGSTGVVEDLIKMGFDITKYKKDLDAEHCRMLYFFEYGYDYFGSSDDYGLYVYVWNPTGKPIDTTNWKNSIELQISPTSNVDRDGLGFKKYKLQLCNYSTLQGYEYVFYKFKIVDARSFLKSLNRDLRNYDISGIELQHSGNAKPTDYKVGGVYSFDGYMPYHSKLKGSANTLHVSVIDRLTIDLKMTPVSWKTQTSDKGSGYQYEMFSVYFSVPNDIIRDYGNPANKEHKGLVQIDGQYSKHKINGLVTNDKSLSNSILPYLNKWVDRYDSTIPFKSYTEYDSSYNGAGIPYSYYYENPFNCLKDSNDMPYYSPNGVYRSNIIPVINSIIYYSGSEFKEISQQDLSDQLYSAWEGVDLYCQCEACRTIDGYGPFLETGYGSDLSYSIIAGEDLTEQIATYASNHDKTFLGWLNGSNKLVIEDEIYEDAKSIQAIDLVDLYLSGTTDILKDDSTIAKDFYMSESDVNSFVSFVSKEFVKDKTTYLMRFAVEDYYCKEATVEYDGTKYKDGEYYFEKTIFQDIDIFTFTFENEYAQRVIIPVIASPVDNFGTITPVNPNGKDGGLSFLGKLFVIIAFILILALICILISSMFGVSPTWLLSNFAKVIVWILSLPFKFFTWIFVSIKTLGGQPLKSSKKDKEKK